MDSVGKKGFAHYDRFGVAPKGSGYQIYIEKYSGNAGWYKKVVMVMMVLSFLGVLALRKCLSNCLN